MISFPNAKINLGLHITAKRSDGYHDIESCFYPIPWNDALEIIPADELVFKSYGLDIPGDPSSNLCVKAYELLKKDFDLQPVEIILYKKIPMGAGLGGGSADGAFVLKLLNDHFNLDLTNTALENYALQLGSDCPFFIQNHPTIAKGRGEIFEPTHLDLSGKFLAIKNPDIHISTKEAFAGITLNRPTQALKNIVESPITQWKNNLVNDFELSIFTNYPEIKQLKELLYASGASYASMTGSGSTVYGLFEKRPDLDWKILEL